METTVKNNEQMAKSISNLTMSFGVDGIVTATYDAIYTTISNYLYRSEDADSEEVKDWLTNVLDDVYVLCEKGKTEIAMIEACRNNM